MSHSTPTRCQQCGGELTQGYLLGKHNRIRWSTSRKGMTVFHGVPLLRYKKGFRSNWQTWFYAPSLPAARCEQCRIAFFTYNNDDEEKPRNEFIATAVMALFFCFGGMLVGGGALLLMGLDAPLPAPPVIIVGLFSVPILLIGLVSLKRAVKLHVAGRRS